MSGNSDRESAYDQDTLSRFWAKVNKDGPNGCWEWTGQNSSEGYSIFMCNHKTRRAHHVSWEIVNGPISVKMWISHTCNNKKCVRPDHLSIYTCKDKVLERFWSKVNHDNIDGCWEWQGNVNELGYGIFRYGHKRQRAHRFSWEAVHGPILEDMLVLHKCDNPKCIRPDHLFLGNHMDNTHDMMSKGRDNHYIKLTWEQVETIRSTYDGKWGSRAKLADQYHVSRSLIGLILNGKTRLYPTRQAQKGQF